MRFSIILVLSVIFVSCTNKSLTELSDDSICNTSIEGNFISGRIYTGKVPVLFKKKKYNESIKVYGELLKTGDDGFLFQPEKLDEPILYKPEEVTALINKNNELVFGKVPDKFLDDCNVTLVLVKTHDPQKQEFEIELEPNKRFGYCISPGSYKVQSIFFKNEHEFVDQAINYDTLLINVQEGLNNYIGDIYLDNHGIEGEKFRLPYVNKFNPMVGASGAVFGIAGALAASLSTEYDYKNVHTFTINENEEFIKESKRKTITNLFSKQN